MQTVYTGGNGPFPTNPTNAIRLFLKLEPATGRKDAKAVAQGVVDGLKQKGPVNLNKASDSELKTLPGIDQDAAQRIIEGRPYADASELVKKHIVSKAEYDRIADKITAK